MSTKKNYKINLHRFSDSQNFKSTPAEAYQLQYLAYTKKYE